MASYLLGDSVRQFSLVIGAYLSALGFAFVLLNFVPISYFLTRSHNF